MFSVVICRHQFIMGDVVKDAAADAVMQDELTPLHCAARNGHDSVITALLDRSATVNTRSKNHLTPLHMSAQGDHIDCAAVLIDRGALVDAGTRVRLSVIAVCFGLVSTAMLENVQACFKFLQIRTRDLLRFLNYIKKRRKRYQSLE